MSSVRKREKEKDSVKIRSIKFFFFAEHMEEDDPTPHALPRWVELEYKVSGERAHTLVSNAII